MIHEAMANNNKGSSGESVATAVRMDKEKAGAAFLQGIHATAFLSLVYLAINWWVSCFDGWISMP